MGEIADEYICICIDSLALIFANADILRGCGMDFHIRAMLHLCGEILVSGL